MCDVQDMRSSLIGQDQLCMEAYINGTAVGLAQRHGSLCFCLVPATLSDCKRQKHKDLGLALVYLFIASTHAALFFFFNTLPLYPQVLNQMASRSGRPDRRPMTPNTEPEPPWERSSRSCPTSISKSTRSGSRSSSQFLYRRLVASPPIKLVPKCNDPTLLLDDDSEPDLAPGLEEDISSQATKTLSTTTSSVRSVTPGLSRSGSERNGQNPSRTSPSSPRPSSPYYPPLPLPLPLPSPSKVRRISYGPYPETPESNRRRPETPSTNTIATARSRQQPSPDTVIFSPSASRSGRLGSISPSPIPRTRRARRSIGRSTQDTDDTRETTETYSDEQTRVASASDHYYLYQETDPDDPDDPDYNPEEDEEEFEDYEEYEIYRERQPSWVMTQTESSSTRTRSQSQGQSQSQSQSQDQGRGQGQGRDQFTPESLVSVSNREIQRYTSHPGHSSSPSPSVNGTSIFHRTNLNEPLFLSASGEEKEEEYSPLGPPCRGCRSPSTFSITSHFNRNGNAGRPFYKCPRPECHIGFVTWADRIGVEEGNPDCDCGKTSRKGVTGACAWRGPGKVFYKCAEGRCSFWAEE